MHPLFHKKNPFRRLFQFHRYWMMGANCINNQTFINGIVAFEALGRPYFGVHQAAIFPVYFSLQSFLPVLVGLTSTSRLRNVWSLGCSRTLVLVMVTGLINLVIFRPLTQGAVRARNAQGMFFTQNFEAFQNNRALGPGSWVGLSSFNAKIHAELRDKKDRREGPSKELVECTKRFMIIHGTSIFINVIGLFATVHYGIGIGMRLS